MKLHMLLIVGLTLGSVTGCGEKEQVMPETAAPMTEEPAGEAKDWRSEAFLKHMHNHAERLDNLNFALANGDLDAAMTPAYWLSRHEAVNGIPTELQIYLNGMREAARAVELSTDIAAARNAAERITLQCQGCHAAAGIDTGP